MSAPSADMSMIRQSLSGAVTEACGEIIHLYFCKIDSYHAQQLDEDEFLNVERIPLEKAVEMVMNHEIPDAKTQVAVLKTAVLLNKLNGK